MTFFFLQIQDIMKKQKKNANAQYGSLFSGSYEEYKQNLSTFTSEFKNYLLKYQNIPTTIDFSNEPYQRCWTKDISEYATHYNNIDVLLAPLVESDFNKYKQLVEKYKYRTLCVDFSDVSLEQAKKWNSERKSEHYYKMAKKQNYRSRASYKLQQLNKRFKIIKAADKVVDLGAAPGGWSACWAGSYVPPHGESASDTRS